MTLLPVNTAAVVRSAAYLAEHEVRPAHCLSQPGGRHR